MFPGGKGGQCVGLTTLPPSCADYLEMWKPHLLEPLGPVMGLLYLLLESTGMKWRKSQNVSQNWRYSGTP